MTGRVLGEARYTADRIRRLARRWTREQLLAPPCRRGCALCCYQPVGTLISEGVMIAWTLQLRGEEPPELGHRERGTPCPFLRDGECSVYVHRPISCSTLYPKGTTCTATTRNLDNTEPVHAARALDIRFCRVIGQPWLGPLYLPAAVRLGRALLERRPYSVDFSDRCMSQAAIHQLTGRP